MRYLSSILIVCFFLQLICQPVEPGPRELATILEEFDRPVIIRKSCLTLEDQQQGWEVVGKAAKSCAARVEIW